ncbi:MAG: ABC transporter permease [Odoribacteraceae bacterium]|jgi:hypothetical protein|nr:ABC transporter permease [Odoribacteraceae bacterium]
MNIIRKLLLYKHLSWTQLTGFFIAGLAGSGIVLFGVQAWADVHPFFSPDDGFIRKDYIVITKKITTIGLIDKQATLFSPNEQEQLRAQPFADRVGAFTASRFRVSAGIEAGGTGFATDMFFESVADEFVDVKSDRWTFSAGDDEIPIVIPRNYLNLYNFGFARSRDLPRISESVIEMLHLTVRVAGNGKNDTYKGKIIGFSNRLNTILVPETFMTWANNYYGNSAAGNPARLIVETRNPADKEIARYFQERGYEAENDKLNDGSVVWFLNLLTTFVVGIGLLICALALYLLTISIYLVIQKNSEKLMTLSLLGYRAREIAAPYQALVVIVNAVVAALALGGTLVARSFYIPFLTRIWPEFAPGNIFPALLCGISLFLLVCLLNIVAVRVRVRKINTRSF